MLRGRSDEHFPAIFLYSELLPSRGYFACAVRIEVGLFELLEEDGNLAYILIDARLFCIQFEEDGCADIDADGSVQLVVAGLQLLQQGNCLAVSALELSPHYYNHFITNLPTPLCFLVSGAGSLLLLFLICLCPHSPFKMAQ
jgi:hypothetical protein